MSKNKKNKKQSSAKTQSNSNISADETKKQNTGTNKKTKGDKAEKKEEVKEISLVDKIYGNEPVKEVLPFPNSEIQTQARNIITEYMIDVTRLPQDIITSLNELIQIFTEFASNSLQFGLVPAIMDKDLTATNLIKNWIKERSDLLLEHKKNTLGESSSGTISGSSSVSVINTPNVNSSITLSTPTLNPSPASVTQTQPTNPTAGNPNPLSPRENNGGTYSHTPQTQSATNIISPAGSNENKNIHYEMLSKANSEITANNHAQQNLQAFQDRHKYEPAVVDREKYIADYTKTIFESMTNTFQSIHWGYVPLDIVQQILSGGDKAFTYEIVNDRANSFIKISDGKNTLETGKFTIG